VGIETDGTTLKSTGIEVLRYTHLLHLDDSPKPVCRRRGAQYSLTRRLCHGQVLR